MSFFILREKCREQKTKIMRKTILLLGVLFLLVSTGKAQQRIVYILDDHERIESIEMPDSLRFNCGYDNVGNPITVEIINPCYDRPDPVISSSGSLAICTGDSVILTAPPSISYRWSRGDTTRSIIVKQAGLHLVTTFNTLNCFKTSIPVEVKVNPLPQPTIDTSGPTIFCPGSTVALSSSLNGTYS